MKRFVRKTISDWAVIMVLAALMMGVLPSFAGTTIGVIDWDTNVPVPAWQGTNSNVGVSVIATNSDHWLAIAFTNSVPSDMLVYGRATNLFAGAWRSEYWIEFNFWSDGTDPTALEVRWGDDDSDDIWAYALTPSAVSGWQTLRTAPLGDVGEWTNVGLGNPTDYLADLSSIDWIGIYIERTGTGNASYGIDDVSLMVPEPAEILMLAAAFGVGLLVFRRMRLVPS